MSIFETLKEESIYAIQSESRDLVYETYGKAKMAAQLGAVNKDEFMELNRMLVREGINNPAAKLR